MDNPHAFSHGATSNLPFLEELYERYQREPEAIDKSFEELFADVDSSFEEGRDRRAAPSAAAVETPPQELAVCRIERGELRIAQLIDAYRNYGHLSAHINPLASGGEKEPWQLQAKNYGFSSEEWENSFPTCGLMKEGQATLREIVSTLKEIYCGAVGIEYMGVQNKKLVEWVQEQIEPTRFSISLPIEEKQRILENLNRSELFENFLHTKYVGQKRFSLEGGETLIPILASMIHHGAELGIEQFDIGMAHRGRLNVLSNILNKSYSQIFTEFEDRWQPNTYEGSGDVKYHKGFSSKLTTSSNKKVLVELAPNPSHLEAVNPVVEGIVRAKQLLLGKSDSASRVAPILIHGDAAIAGQGIIYETLQMYDLDGYSTGGTLHVVINNQVGFTAQPEEGRSTYYCTDIARAFNAPVFHVNGEEPESCIFATMLAVAIRQKFHCDVFIDLNCYRKYGHNEADEPAFTQPREYAIIRKKQSVREIYRDNLINQGVMERKMALALEDEFKENLQEALQGIRYGEEKAPPKKSEGVVKSKKLSADEMLRRVDTSIKKELIASLGEKITSTPKHFHLHKKLQHLYGERRAMAMGEKAVDWGMAELLAYATLLNEGVNVRISGQDCGRGTFSHRQARLVDQENYSHYFPLAHIKEGQGRFDVINSLLSEYGVLGFEYGYSLAMPESLVIWEAQFGDFANGAQVMIDQFISSSEQKWGQKNNLVLFLPHGYEGQGPEHSSARIERFLAISADLNWFVVNATTPAQLFHLLRRQILRRSPKPLVLFTPKALLRHPACVSSLESFEKGSFEEVIDDPNPPEKCRRIAFCSGKVYYDATHEREKREEKQTAFVRIEQLYPLHEKKIRDLLATYGKVKEYCWLQEEPQNMGGWKSLSRELEKLLPGRAKLRYVGRAASAASATGSLTRHKHEFSKMMDDLFVELK